jgi:cellulose synthase/poly-beta-1,6-N-acetylglucosamine synthase-like glycosyltransferase
MAENNPPGVSVVVCAFTQRRWQQTRAALESALRQEPAPAEVLLVVDHNAELADRARREFTSVSVLENAGTQGLSGARNTGLKAATEPVTAFLDDDAEARPGWLEQLVAPYSSPDVVATGGSVYPRWPAASPLWLPAEFYWVVGCSYRGLPETTGQVRNPIGANMSMLTDPALEVGGFDESVGRVGANTRGCEETELSIRLTASRAGSVILYVPAAAVDHHVAPERLTLSYFVHRCWHEGMSKADVVRLAGATAGLQRERRQTALVIPAALLREVGRLATGHVSAAARISATMAGLTAASAGYFGGRTSQRIHQRRGRS